MTIREEEETKLHIAARLNNLKLLRAGLREALLIDALGIYGWTALHQAASCGHLEIAIALLENGANPNIQDSQKCTPIHLAARNGHLEVVRSLYRNGARLDLRNAEGKIPQNCADEECRTFLERQRTKDVIKLSPSPIEDDHSLRKIYGHKSNQSPVLKKQRQSSPQWSESSQSSQESMSSSCSDSSESFSASSIVCHPGPGEMRVSFDLNKNRQSLVIYVGEIKDVKLPADHNMSHVYVKAYLIPDKSKSTKRKTSLHKLQRIDAQQSSTDSVTSWDGVEAENEKPSEKGMGRRLVSSLKRGTRLSQKKKGQDQVKSTAQPSVVPVYRISTLFGEYFRYDACDLRRVNVETCKVLLTVCGRNRVTTQGQPIACLSLPLAGYAKMTTPEWYPLIYKITLPSGFDVAEELQAMRASKSWEQKGGKFTGRSLAWNEPMMSMSMPNIDYTTSSRTSQTVQRASLGGEGGFPTDGSTKYKKHSGAGKVLRKQLNIVQGKGNYRYKNSTARQECEDEETAVDSFTVDIAERSATIPGAGRAGSDLNKTLREQNRDIGEKLRDLPRSRMHGSSRRSTASNIEINDYSVAHERPNPVTEVISLDDEEPSSRPELEHRSSFAGSLKYSRAFQQQTSAARRRDAVLNDMDVEDFDDVADTPFAVSNFYGRKSGIACN
ncbi:uncharacterized protein LOC144657477 [Oculina patagonica]